MNVKCGNPSCFIFKRLFTFDNHFYVLLHLVTQSIHCIYIEMASQFYNSDTARLTRETDIFLIRITAGKQLFVITYNKFAFFFNSLDFV
jgi:hypothetical protein